MGQVEKEAKLMPGPGAHDVSNRTRWGQYKNSFSVQEVKGIMQQEKANSMRSPKDNILS